MQPFFVLCRFYAGSTVRIKSWDEGRVRLRRVYGFEYSDTGHDRRKGRMTMVGHRVSALHIGSRSVPGGVTLH
jgi:hypothetical protein